MGDVKNLSFSTGFNQPKIILNSSRTVSVPVSVGTTPDTLFTLATGAERLPVPPKIFIEYAGELGPAFGSYGTTGTVLGIQVLFIASFNSSFDLVLRSYSLEVTPVDVTLYYRVYIDAEPA